MSVDLEALKRRGIVVTDSAPYTHVRIPEHEFDAILAALERAQRVKAAAREMLKFGEHEGFCSKTGPCLLHREAFEGRRAALEAALEPQP